MKRIKLVVLTVGMLLQPIVVFAQENTSLVTRFAHGI